MLGMCQSFLFYGFNGTGKYSPPYNQERGKLFKIWNYVGASGFANKRDYMSLLDCDIVLLAFACILGSYTKLKANTKHKPLTSVAYTYW